jgi:PadR family transcriptional regulator
MEGSVPLKGHLDLVLLAAVRVGPSHGYAITQEVKRKSRGEFKFSDGTVYATLHQLQEDGFLKSRWETPEGRRCRVYELTDKGLKRLAEQETDWWRFVKAMRAVLDTR